MPDLRDLRDLLERAVDAPVPFDFGAVGRRVDRHHRRRRTDTDADTSGTDAGTERACSADDVAVTPSEKVTWTGCASLSDPRCLDR